MSNVDVGGSADEYLVKLDEGILVMSSAELDEAFWAGQIGERTPVVAPGGSSWTTLAKLAGLDEDGGYPASS
jgi:hypothetical protein